MRVPKSVRQARIAEIVNTQEIGRQEELVEILNAEGYSVTQATISRDINEMHIFKVSVAVGKQKFVLMKSKEDPNTRRLLKVFAEAVTNSKIAGNLIIIHTLPGMAPAGASAIDALEMPQIAGTIAGDDCIFIAVTSDKEVRYVEAELMQYVSEVHRK